MEPAEAYTRWHSWAVTGTKKQFADMFAHLNSNLPSGWRLTTGKDCAPFRALVIDTVRAVWYSTDSTESHIGALLSIVEVRESELRGGQVLFAGPPYPGANSNIPNTWREVVRLLDEGIVPAAHAVGAAVRLPTPEDVFLSELPFEIRDRLQRFSSAARKTLPLNRREAESWHSFVVAAFRSKTIVDAEPLAAWLMADGWPKELAAHLSLLFFDQSLLLTQFADELVIA